MAIKIIVFVLKIYTFTELGVLYFPHYADILIDENAFVIAVSLPLHGTSNGAAGWGFEQAISRLFISRPTLQPLHHRKSYLMYRRALS